MRACTYHPCKSFVNEVAELDHPKDVSNNSESTENQLMSCQWPEYIKATSSIALLHPGTLTTIVFTNLFDSSFSGVLLLQYIKK